MKYLKYILSLLLIVTLGACDSFLNDPEPEQELIFDDQLQDAEQVQDALIGLYNEIQDGDITGSQSRFFSEIANDNVIFDGSFTTYQEIQALSIVPDNGSVDAMWDEYFDTINTANLIIRDAANVEDAPGFDSGQVIGQARFIRGFAYFSAVRYFAQPWSTGNNQENLGLPIVTEPVTGEDGFRTPTRSSVAETYQQAITDIQAAADALPGRIAEGQANRFVALSMLARIRLNQQLYEEAATLANTIITSGGFQLDDDVTAIWRSELTDESIFELIQTEQDNPGINNSLPAFYAIDGRDDAQLGQGFLDAAGTILNDRQQTQLDASGQTATDTRISELTSVGTDGVPTAAVDNSLKYDDGVNTADNTVIMRLAEMMLTRAEALAQTEGLNQESVDLVNQIRRRAFEVTDANGDPTGDSNVEYVLADFSSAQELIDAILLERRVELAFEGERLFDIKRTQQTIPVLGGLPFDAPRAIFPIPQDELDANSNITQNPFYL